MPKKTGSEFAGARRRTGQCVAAALTSSLLWAVPTAALSDTFHPFVGVSYGYDDNLLRLPDTASGQLSDRTRAAVAGLSFDRQYGLQQFTGSAKATRVSFEHFSELDYTGKDAALDWRWMLGPRLEGHVGATYQQTLTSFSDYHATERNLRTHNTRYFEGNWRFHPSWRLHGRVSRDKYDYALASQRALDRREDSKEVGVDYLAASGSSIGLVAREITGDYPNPARFAGVLLDQGYTQRELKLKAFWALNGVTQLQFLGGRARREHNFFTLRDASGTNGRLTVLWTPTGTLRLTANGWREFTPFEGSSAAYSLDNGYSVDAVWAATSKIQANASLKRVRRDFVGQLALNVPLDAEDRTRNANLGVTYAPTTYLSLSASVFHEVRKPAAFFNNGYRANGATLNASFQF